MTNEEMAVQYSKGYQDGFADGMKHKARGYWTVDEDRENRRWDWRRFYCSACGRWQTYGTTRYCMHCGAEMRGESE